ncbi:Meiotic recombination protein rec8 [Madurella mycetomatis]|uniref:Meiotic recombination protein rec8 n=1 Tax=Madurella mycetomatis TaxID=100816 RepID=A0A175W713_9PEZI|nr:Meiotic recombination protein rec8 [Madurella mycetomatis]
MFYSHEILTSHQHGVATVWLVSTTGLRSTTRRISRKAIQDVNVQKACETILKPGAPIALRLQGSLLYGVTRVYSQQCHYVLTDAERVQAHMRAFHKGLSGGDNALDPQAGKSRRKELILEDDPAFELRIDLPAFHFNNDDNQVIPRDSQVSRKTSSQLSPLERDSSLSSSDRSRLAGFDLPQASFSREIPLIQGPFRAGTMTPDKGDDVLMPFDNEERELPAFNDWGIEVDADGNVVTSVEEPQLPRLPGPGPEGGVPIMHQGDFIPFDAEGDVVMSGGVDTIASDPPFVPQQPDEPEQEQQEPRYQGEDVPMEDEANSAQALVRVRRQRRRAVFAHDDQTKVSRQELRLWSTNYLANAEQASQRRHGTTAAEARKNAFDLIFGRGIAGVGFPTGVPGLSHPLAPQFAREGLQAHILGIFIEQPYNWDRGDSRGRRRSALEALELEDEDAQRRVRPRLSQEADDQDQHQPHQPDDGPLFADEADLFPVELGRRAASTFPEDIPSDVPWNRGSSQIPSSSVKGGESRPPSRQVSASPLYGRSRHSTIINPLGPGLEHEVERFSDQPIFGSDDFGGEGDGGFGLLHSALEFSLDPILPVQDENTPAQPTSQVLRTALDREGHNFLSFIEDVAREKGYRPQEEEDGIIKQWVEFEQLFESADQKRAVVAQAFYHVLSLATKNIIKVTQDGQGGNEAFGVIRLGVDVSAAVRAEVDEEGTEGGDEHTGDE